MLFHDWIAIPPLSDIEALKSTDSNAYRLLGSVINGMFVLIPLVLTFIYFKQEKIPILVTSAVTFFYALLTFGTILSWWVPYIFGSSKKHKQQFEKFKNTHHFLPPRGDNVVPNTLHVILHLQVWICLIIAINYLINRSL